MTRLPKRRVDCAAIAACMLVLVAITLQVRIGYGLWGSDLAAPDDPAHYTTGVMVYEYFRTALFSNPMAFARDFYSKFPKVALGHWPPVYYILQTAAYMGLGPSIGTARLLSALICGACAAVLFIRVRRIHGALIGALCAACFLALPIVQVSSWQVMSDLLLSLLFLLAATSFADFLDRGGLRDAAFFAVFASLAILTKGSGWALGIFFVLTPLIAKQLSCFQNQWYWISGLAVLLLSVPFYLIARSLRVGYPANTSHLLSAAVTSNARFDVLTSSRQVVPILVLFIAIAGAVALFRARNATEAACLAMVLSQAIFLFILPLTEEPRYFMPSVAALMVMFGRGLTLCGPRAGPLALTAVCFLFFPPANIKRVDGYRAAVDCIPYDRQGSVMLISSDAAGEGAFIAERLEHDRARAGVVLRSSKVLAKSTWSGDNYRLVFDNPGAIFRYLRDTGVQYVVVDGAAVPKPDRELLRIAVRSAPETFQLIGHFPIWGARNGEIAVYQISRGESF